MAQNAVDKYEQVLIDMENEWWKKLCRPLGKDFDNFVYDSQSL
jgi:hypothetical protein